MNKKIIRCFLSLFASALMAHAAHAENSATFTLTTPRYYKDGNVVFCSDIWNQPEFVSGTRGTFTVFQGAPIPTTSSYSGNSKIPAGYYISKWQLYTTGGGTVISTWENVNSINITFDFKWASKYGTWLELYAHLSPITYTLAYDANGGTWTAGAPVGGTHKYLDAITTPPASCAARENYDLTGWKSSGGQAFAAGAGFTGKELGITMNGQSATLYAQWKGKTFSVTLETDGGTVATPLTSYTYGVGATLPKATKEDSSFVGWYTNPSFTGNPVTSISKTDSGDKTFYAKFEQNVFSVTLNKDGGTVAKGTDVTSYVYGKGATLPTLEKSKSIFAGWYDNPQFSGSVVTKITTTDSGDKEFWAKFTRQDTVVHYNGNGATSGNMADSSFAEGKATALTANAFKRAFTVTYDANGGSGGKTSDTATFTFTGWNDKPNGSGSYTYYDKQVVTNPCGSTGDPVTLYAMWNSATVTLPKPTGSGDFEGWFTSGGIRVGGAGQEYEPSNDITLYARWKGEKKDPTYTIHFSPNADVVNSGAVADRTVKSGVKIDELPDGNVFTNLASTGFVGWEYNEKLVDKNFSYTPINDGETVLLKAKWKDCGELSKAVGLNNAVLTNVGTGEGWKVDNNNGYSKDKKTCVSCNKNGQKMEMSVKGPGSISFRHKGKPLKVLIDGKRIEELDMANSYNVDPHSYDVTGGVHTIAFSSSADGNNFIDNMTWTWKPDNTTRTIEVSAKPESAGTVSVSDGSEHKIGDKVTLTATAKSGYTFEHWSDGSMEKQHTVTVTCDETYQAIFSGGGGTETSNYYILFDGNGAANLGAMVGQSVDCGATVKLDENKFLRSGYKFLGWATERYGKVAYADQATVNLSSKENDAITLYAVWEESSTPTPGPTPGPEPEPEPGVYVSSVGEAVEVDLAGDYSGYTIKSVSGLPTGLKYNKKTGYVTGTPTKAVSKENNVTITFTDKTKVKATWTVEPLPTMMVGTYYGAAVVDGIAGQFQLKLAATGKATGYFYAAGKKISFKSTGLVDLGNGYAQTVSYTYNRTKCTDEILLAKAATVDGVDIWSAALGSDSEAMDDAEARRDTIKEVFGKVVPKTTTCDVLEKTDEGEYLKAKVTTAGAVTVSGKLMSEAGKLTSVSCSTHLVVDNDGRAYCYVTIYKAVSKSEPIVYDEVWYLPED